MADPWANLVTPPGQTPADQTPPTEAPKPDPWAGYLASGRPASQVDYSNHDKLPDALHSRLQSGVALAEAAPKESFLGSIWSAAKEGNDAGYNADAMRDDWKKMDDDVAQIKDPTAFAAAHVASSVVKGTENYLHTINGLIMGAGAATGQAISRGLGQDEADQAKARREMAQFFMVAPLHGGGLPAVERGPLIPTKTGELARITRGPDGKPDAQVVGGFPQPEHFTQAADRLQEMHAQSQGTTRVEINGKDVSAEYRVNAEKKLYDLWKNEGVHPAEVVHDAQDDAMLRHDLGAAATVPNTLPAPVSINTQPLPAPGAWHDTVSGLRAKLFDFGKDVQMSIAPMAVGDDIIPKATSKDFANTLRVNAWDMDRWMRTIDEMHTPERQKEMFLALDEENQWRAAGDVPPQGVGLSSLPAHERATVERIMAHNTADALKAIDLGLLEEHSPAYAARIAVGIKRGDGPGTLPLNSLGMNLKSTSSRFKGRKYATIEESEAALQAKHPGATIARTIKANVLAMKQVRDAIAGKEYVNAIKEYSARAGTELVTEGGIDGRAPSADYFTIDHPSLKTYTPKPYKVDGEWTFKKDEDGKTIMHQVPLYIHKDWEGPVRAVLTGKPSSVVNALVEGKSKAMSIIMYSPMTHNAVIYAKAMAGFKGNPIKTAMMYWKGNKVRNDPAQMVEAISNGMVPIGKRFFKQDLTDQLTDAPLTKHEGSWSAHVGQMIAGDKGADAISKMGNFWHNTLLWDRVADLQAGTYAHFRDEFMQSGMDRETSARMAAHEANRLAGSLPKEAMSAGARNIGNLLFFSRTFTLGNLGIMKDAITGLPKDVLAQIERDAGPNAAKDAKSIARRTAQMTVATDMALFYVGTSVMQSAVNVLLNGQSLSDEAANYWSRLQNQMAHAWSNPWSMVPPWGIYSFLQNVGATGDNEPGKADRAFIGYDRFGAGIYAKSPMGRIGEEFGSYSQGFWRDMLLRKESTIVRPLWQIMSNDKGFGRKVFDPHIEGVGDGLHAAWSIARHFAESQAPMLQAEGFYDLVTGQGDQKVNALRTIGPFLPPPFTFQVSKGHPGGPAAGFIADEKDRQKFRVQQAMPGIRKMFQNNEDDRAYAEMEKLGMTKRDMQFYQKAATGNLKTGASTVQKFYNQADPESVRRYEKWMGGGQQ